MEHVTLFALASVFSVLRCSLKQSTPKTAVLETVSCPRSLDCGPQLDAEEETGHLEPVSTRHASTEYHPRAPRASRPPVRRWVNTNSEVTWKQKIHQIVQASLYMTLSFRVHLLLRDRRCLGSRGRRVSRAAPRAVDPLRVRGDAHRHSRRGRAGQMNDETSSYLTHTYTHTNTHTYIHTHTHTHVRCGTCVCSVGRAFGHANRETFSLGESQTMMPVCCSGSFDSAIHIDKATNREKSKLAGPRQ